MCTKQNKTKKQIRGRQITCFVLQSCRDPRGASSIFFTFLICQIHLLDQEARNDIWLYIAELLARSGHSLGMMMKCSAGGTARCGKWSKRPRCRWSSGRSGSASLMDGPPSLPGILSLFCFFFSSLISLLLLSLKWWLHLHNYSHMHTKAYTGIKVSFCWNGMQIWKRCVLLLHVSSFYFYLLFQILHKCTNFTEMRQKRLITKLFKSIADWNLPKYSGMYFLSSSAVFRWVSPVAVSLKMRDYLCQIDSEAIWRQNEWYFPSSLSSRLVWPCLISGWRHIRLPPTPPRASLTAGTKPWSRARADVGRSSTSR